MMKKQLADMRMKPVMIYLSRTNVICAVIQMIGCGWIGRDRLCGLDDVVHCTTGHWLFDLMTGFDWAASLLLVCCLIAFFKIHVREKQILQQERGLEFLILPIYNINYS